MSIDWITVVAQVVNFLILVWLLHRFLYGPVIRAMDKREQRIADQLAEAAQAQEEAAAQGRAYQAEQAELEGRKQAILSEARADADATKRKLLIEARAAADARRREWLGQIEAQQEQFLLGLRRRVADEYIALARQMLREMADADLETQMIDVFLRHMEELDPAMRDKLLAGAREAGVVTVESRLEPSEQARARLLAGVQAALGADVEVVYSAAPAGPFGIELRAGSQTVKWTFDDYLNRLEKSLSDMLADRLPAAPTPVASEVSAS